MSTLIEALLVMVFVMAGVYTVLPWNPKNSQAGIQTGGPVLPFSMAPLRTETEWRAPSPAVLACPSGLPWLAQSPDRAASDARAALGTADSAKCLHILCPLPQ